MNKTKCFKNFLSLKSWCFPCNPSLSWHSCDSKAVWIWFQILLKLLYPEVTVMVSETHCKASCYHGPFIFVCCAGSLAWPPLTKGKPRRITGGFQVFPQIISDAGNFMMNAID